MGELLIDVYEKVKNNRHVIISIVKINNQYVIENCIVEHGNISLVSREKFGKLEKAKEKFEKLKATA